MGKRLIVAEKPSVGRDIANVLNCRENGNGCRIGKDDIVTWAVGHLVGVCSPDEMNERYAEWKIVVEQQGEKIVLCQAPLGASAAAQNMDSLIACGVEKIVCAGSCSHRFSDCGFTLLTDEQPVVSILRYDLCGFICRRNQDISGGRKVFGKSPARRLYLAASMISYR